MLQFEYSRISSVLATPQTQKRQISSSAADEFAARSLYCSHTPYPKATTRFTRQSA